MAQRTLVHLLDFVPRESRSFDVYLLRLTEHMHGQGWRVVHVFAGEPAPGFGQRLGELGSPYIVTKFPLTSGRAHLVAKQLRRYRPEVIQVAFVSKFSPWVLVLKWLAGPCHLVIADHSSGAVRRRGKLGACLARARGFLTGRIVSRIVCVSDYVRRRDEHELHLPAAKLCVIYNGVDTLRYRPLQSLSSSPNGVPTVVYAGQLIPGKGLDTLFDAIRLVVDGGYAVRLCVAGAGPQEKRLRRLVEILDLSERVEFLGHCGDVPRLFSQADVVVVPSMWEEAFGYVVAEAMSCGVPVITSDAGGIPEVVGTDEIAGLIFRRGDAKELSTRLLSLLSDRRRRRTMGDAARLRVAANFSIERMIDAYAAVFDEVTRRPGSRQRHA